MSAPQDPAVLLGGVADALQMTLETWADDDNSGRVTPDTQALLGVMSAQTLALEAQGWLALRQVKVLERIANALDDLSVRAR